MPVVIAQSFIIKDHRIVRANGYIYAFGYIAICWMKSQVSDIPQNLIADWVDFDTDVFLLDELHQLGISEEVKSMAYALTTQQYGIV